MRYVGATQYATILEAIHEIQAFEEANVAEANLDVDMEDDGLRVTSPGGWVDEPDLLFGDTQPITIRQVMAALPTRLRTDYILGIYDKPRFTQTPIIHCQQFRRQYEAFWQSPDTTSFLWISILFSSLATSVLSDMQLPSREAALAQKRLYMKKARQCLVTGEYLKAKPFAVEAMVFYALSRVHDSQETSSFLWPAISLAARLAQRMGYHRDTAHARLLGRQPVTPFQAEMRRRVWCCIEAFDLMLSFQLNIPTIIQADRCDVAPPSNLHDEDFDEDTAALPPSRPETEPTGALYYRYKCRLVRHLRRIMLHALSFLTPDYGKTMLLDTELEGVYHSCPISLRLPHFRDAGQGTRTKTASHIVSLEVMYLRGLCILHRPYLARRKCDLACERSRRSCRQSALRILDLQAELEAGVQLGERMFEEGYDVLTLSKHDLLIAAMILCLDLRETVDLATEDREIEIIALQATYTNCYNRRATSRDAAHATRVLGAMLAKMPKSSNRPSLSPMNSQLNIKPPPPKRTSNLRDLLEPLPEPPQPLAPRQTLTLSPGLARLGHLTPDSRHISPMLGTLDDMTLDHEDVLGGILESGDIDWVRHSIFSFIIELNLTDVQNLLDAYITDHETNPDLSHGSSITTTPGGEIGGNTPSLPKPYSSTHTVPILPTQQHQYFGHHHNNNSNDGDQQRDFESRHNSAFKPYNGSSNSNSSIPQISVPWNHRAGKDTALPLPRDEQPQQQATAPPRPHGGFSVGDLMNP